MEGLSVVVLVVVFGLVLAGGLVTGITGFGQAIVSTATIATVLAPEQAVTVMILPLLAANVSLVRELDADGLRRCARRFWPYVLAATLGTVVGMALLGRVPTALLSLAIGVFTLLYVLLSQERVTVPGKSRLAGWCFDERPARMAGLGVVSGAVFGASNVAVQIVAFLDSRSLDRQTFVGVLAMILVGVSVVRVAAAFALGLYGSGELFVVSAVAALPSLLGVAAGKRVRGAIPERYQVVGVFVLLTVIGLRLSLTGIQGV